MDAPSESVPSHPPNWRRQSPGGARRWLFRCLAVLLGPLLLGLVEGICRLGDWGMTGWETPLDPGLSGIGSLFVPDQSGTHYVIRRSRLKFFAPETFPIRKEAGTFRIFCLGGSTVQGSPYSKETAFSTWLKISLGAADGGRTWEVVNCGGVSYASYRLVPILKECLGYEPNLIILCTGHNEFLEDRSYASIKRAPRILLWADQTLRHLRSYRWLQRAYLAAARKQATTGEAGAARLPAEADALLDYRDGLKAYHRDDQWRGRVMEEYEFNVRRLVALARGAGVPVLLIRPPSNLRDCPPFKSEHREDLTAGQLRQWTGLVDQARSHYGGDLRQSIARLRQALEVDGQYAQTFYDLGKCYEALALAGPAREAYLQARELDICPLRMLAPMEECLGRIARETGTAYLDAHELLESQSQWNILGNDWLVDHVHPSIRGHQVLAAAIFEAVTRQGLVRPRANWAAALPALYQAHFDSLDPIYYAHGQRHLENLRAWTQGRADGPPIESRLPADRLRSGPGVLGSLEGR